MIGGLFRLCDDWIMAFLYFEHVPASGCLRTYFCFVHSSCRVSESRSYSFTYKSHKFVPINNLLKKCAGKDGSFAFVALVVFFRYTR